ncbi:MAG: methyltransferase domain-containing protein [Candidatus Zixiibacteriota bacterium]
MTQDNKKIDWSEERWKDMLIYQRKFMWFEDTLDKLAAWLELQPGITTIDVGCGLGNVGYTYWPYFGEGGRYFGVDISSELVQDASKAAKQWAKNGEASFIVGDAYKLPFPDDFADCTMCQTLLMHLENPELALAEMIRVTKPGSLVMCAEPDNLSSTLAKQYSSLPELDLEEELLCHKVALICNRGRIKLGRGDEGIGHKVPMMMNKLGLAEIDIRLNDRVFHLEPPYEGPVQEHQLESVKKQFSLEDEKNHNFFLEREKEEFLAGGGDPEEFNRVLKIDDRIRPIRRQQIANGEFFGCGGSQFFVIKGRKRLTR